MQLAGVDGIHDTLRWFIYRHDYLRLVPSVSAVIFLVTAVRARCQFLRALSCILQAVRVRLKTHSPWTLLLMCRLLIEGIKFQPHQPFAVQS